ncbi:acyl carrier protein [Corallococcus llansteffanensis]|uniref:acyl carrier protein n=1 Tax=Corallococcus llansteffanensis TaxID=2316731 RepID=UPI0013156159|nr:acyl carrier protein [Corallococcus llansteffanensis]
MHSREEVKADLASRIAKAMYMEPGEIGDDDLFSDFGLESVTLARILKDVCTAYNCDIPIAEFLHRQTLGEASELVHSKLTTPAPASAASGGARS